MAAARRAVPSRSQHAVVELLRAANRCKTLFTHEIEPHGITGQQYNVLRILRGAGPEGVAMLTIAARMVERTPGITRIIDRLERENLVVRERLGGDRRRVHARITPKGLDILERLDRPVELATRAAIAGLTSSEIASLIGLLERIAGPARRGRRGRKQN